MSYFNSTSEEPVGSTQNNRLDRALASVVGNIKVPGVGIETELVPPSKRAGYRICKVSFWRLLFLVFIDPSFKKCESWLSNSFAHVFALLFGKAFCNSLYIKQAFDCEHGKLSRNRIGEPSIFKAALNVSRAIRSCGAVNHKKMPPVSIQNSEFN